MTPMSVIRYMAHFVVDHKSVSVCGAGGYIEIFESDPAHYNMFINEEYHYGGRW